jgi:hypothetical protein
MIPVGLAACLAIFASGCTGQVPEVSTRLAASAPESQGKPPEPRKECLPLPQRLRSTPAALTPVTPDMTRQLILSEIEQNKRIAELVAAYERCRRGRQL